jgi:hypothetical protein
VFVAYGGKCVCCEEDGFGFLTMDHINNDGNQHRKSGRDKGFHFYRRLKQDGFPKDVQILCNNCNLAKYRYGKCPHELIREHEAMGM